MTEVLLPIDRHLDGLHEAVDRLARWSDAAGPDAVVPTCPGWRVGDLVAHQGGVHRWATAMLRGADPSSTDIDTLAADAPAPPDLARWFRDGADDLLGVLDTAPDDLDAFTFLREAPPARHFWARRQHHETAMHALDALAARDRRALTAEDVWFGADVSLDAVDELLVGFWPRPTKGPRTEAPTHALVAPDGGERWLLDLGPDAPVVRRLTPDEPAPPGVPTLSGPATDVHLALWNRGGAPTDPTGLLPTWAAAGIA